MLMTNKTISFNEAAGTNYLDIESKDCLHHSFYCEENVWKLCELIQKQQKSLNTLYVIFISNNNKQVLLWMQCLGNVLHDYLVGWDYHVFLVFQKDNCNSVVYDLDSILPFPTLFEKYFKYAIRPESLKEEFKPYFRIIPASLFLQKFASDRSQMKKSDGTWVKNPPPWPCISTKDCVNNLQDLISMDIKKCDIGQVVDVYQFSQTFLQYS